MKDRHNIVCYDPQVATGLKNHPLIARNKTALQSFFRLHGAFQSSVFPLKRPRPCRGSLINPATFWPDTPGTPDERRHQPSNKWGLNTMWQSLSARARIPASVCVLIAVNSGILRKHLLLSIMIPNLRNRTGSAPNTQGRSSASLSWNNGFLKPPSTAQHATTRPHPDTNIYNPPDAGRYPVNSHRGDKGSQLQPNPAASHSQACNTPPCARRSDSFFGPLSCPRGLRDSRPTIILRGPTTVRRRPLAHGQKCEQHFD